MAGLLIRTQAGTKIDSSQSSGSTVMMHASSHSGGGKGWAEDTWTIMGCDLHGFHAGKELFYVSFQRIVVTQARDPGEPPLETETRKKRDVQRGF
jgi:hypothetical protein